MNEPERLAEQAVDQLRAAESAHNAGDWMQAEVCSTLAATLFAQARLAETASPLVDR